MSRNRIDLSLYLRVVVDPQHHDLIVRRIKMDNPSQEVSDKDVLSYLFEEAFFADNTWPYRIEADAPKGELWVSQTLFSASYDDFDAVWVNDVSTKDEFLVARRNLRGRNISIRVHRMGLVCWYDAADRPFPTKMIGSG